MRRPWKTVRKTDFSTVFRKMALSKYRFTFCPRNPEPIQPGKFNGFMVGRSRGFLSVEGALNAFAEGSSHTGGLLKDCGRIAKLLYNPPFQFLTANAVDSGGYVSLCPYLDMAARMATGKGHASL
jgi:hypothetical protein